MSGQAFDFDGTTHIETADAPFDFEYDKIVVKVDKGYFIADGDKKETKTPEKESRTLSQKEIEGRLEGVGL